MNFLAKLFRKKPALLDWRAFIELFAARARERGYPADIHWGEDLARSSITVSTADGGKYAAYLDTAWQEYQNAPEALDAIITARLNAMGQIVVGITMNAGQIYPNLKPAEWLEAARQIQHDNGTPPGGLLSQPLAGELHLVYVIDTGDAFRTLQRSDLAELGIADEDALQQTALANLRQYSAGRAENHDYGSGIHRLVLDGFLDASLILILPQLTGIGDHPDGILLAVPARDALLYCDAGDSAAIRVLQELAQELHGAAPYPISARLYHLQDGELSEYAPPAASA